MKQDIVGFGLLGCLQNEDMISSLCFMFLSQLDSCLFIFYISYVSDSIVFKISGLFDTIVTEL